MSVSDDTQAVFCLLNGEVGYLVGVIGHCSRFNTSSQLLDALGCLIRVAVCLSCSEDKLRAAVESWLVSDAKRRLSSTTCSGFLPKPGRCQSGALSVV